jgi:hypothetical protein
VTSYNFGSYRILHTSGEQRFGHDLTELGVGVENNIKVDFQEMGCGQELTSLLIWMRIRTGVGLL